MSEHTPTPWRVSNIDAHGGYDGMTDAIHVGPITLDAADYGQLCAGDDRYDKARMIADANFISLAAGYHDRLVEALRNMVKPHGGLQTDMVAALDILEELGELP